MNPTGRHVMGKLLLSVPALLLTLLLTGNVWAATGKKHDRAAVFEVPTTGKIVDVVYHPEFDEWWVKCREGDHICIYTYDHRSKEWAKVLFVPKNPEETGKKTEKVRSTVDGAGEQETATPQKSEDGKSGPGKQPGKAEPRTDKKWWDPLKILKSGERLIFPPSSEGTR
jgi:hypothetical protein